MTQVISSATFLASSLRCVASCRKKLLRITAPLVFLQVYPGKCRSPGEDHLCLAFFVIAGRQAKIILVLLSVAIGLLCLAVIISVITCCALKR